jgi:hypothetical protein
MAAQLGKAAVAVTGTVLAAAVLWIAGATHLRRACTVLDTPYLPLCAPPPAAADAAAEALRQRIQRNPGDTDAWAALVVLPDLPPSDGVLQAAAQLAPGNANVQRWKAARALERGDWSKGVAILVQLLRYRNEPGAARVLAQLAVTPQGLDLLRPHLAEAAEDWLPQVLYGMAALKLPPGRALPLVAQAMRHDAFPREAQQAYMRSLKGGGYWLDAYAFWLTQHGRELPLLYNAGFDDAFEPDGFDWELAQVPRSRAGTVVDQPTVAVRGRVLEIEFTGRNLATPMAWQNVFMPPGTYRLRGDYMGSKFRSEEGLAWAVRCKGGKSPLAGRTPPLQDTGGVWKSFELTFTLPEACGPVASLQLEPVASYEAAAGMRGFVAFDNFSLTHALPSGVNSRPTDAPSGIVAPSIPRTRPRP